MSELTNIKYFSMKKLNGKYGVTIGVTLLLFACSLMINVVVDRIVPPVNMISLVLYELVAFLVNLLMGMLVSGRTYLYMNIIYDRPVSFADLKQGFIEHPEKAVILQIPFALSAMLMTVPLEVYQMFFWIPEGQSLMGNLKVAVNPDAVRICLLLSLCGMVVYLAVQILFAQVFFLLHDFPDRRPSELFLASIRMMRGRKLTYALLLLSFLPMFLLSALLFFIPALFVISQLYIAQAGFYRLISEVHSRPGEKTGYGQKA